jgi:hypothetical protein
MSKANLKYFLPLKYSFDKVILLTTIPPKAFLFKTTGQLKIQTTQQLICPDRFSGSSYFEVFFTEMTHQRVLNDLWRTRLSCVRIIRHHTPTTFLPPLPSASCLFSFSVILCVAGRANGRRRWGREGVEPNNTTARKHGPL